MLKSADYTSGAETPVFPLDQWRFRYGAPPCRGAIRLQAEDFVVEEELGFEPAGQGPHGWFYLQYSGENTVDMAGKLAGACGVPVREVGFSGLKDRNAVTSQWFSIPDVCGREAAVQAIQSLCNDHAGMQLLAASANARKLKRGVHRANRFHITVRQLSGDRDAIRRRLEDIQQGGVPNYFGPQRFGRHGSNLQNAVRFFTGQRKSKGRQARSMALSAARSWLFNEVLSERLGSGCWDRPLDGDRMMLAGSRSHFLHDGQDATVIDRIRQGDIHPSGPLWGGGEPLVIAQAAAFEQRVVDAVPLLPEGLVSAGLKQERRALRLMPRSLVWRLVSKDSLALSFSLPSGAFATAVLRELVELTPS